MLNTNKTYDNRNIRDKQKLFNDGVVDIYYASERILKKKKGHYYYSQESVSYQTYLEAEQNSKYEVLAIGISENNVVPEHGDICVINGTFYMLDHATYNDYNRPKWYKLYLNSTTIPYVIDEVKDEIL